MSEATGQKNKAFKRKLRIAILGSRGYPQTYSGYEVFVRALAPRLVERGHEIIVYCRKGLFKERPRYYQGVRLIYLPSPKSKSFGTFSHTLLSVLDVSFRQVDVVFVVNVSNAFHCLVPRLFGKNTAINVDGLDWRRDKWGPLGKRYFFWNAKNVGWICPKGVVTDAHEMRRIYLQEFHTPSVCIAYGAEFQAATDPGVVRQYGLEPCKYYLILSRMVPENNADLIVKAFERVRSSKLLAIAGDANYRSAFVDRLKQTTDSRIRFIGHIGNPDHVKELHCNAYAYLHGHSLGGTNPSLLTALGSSNCVLALDTTFNREVLQDYGVFFDHDPAHLAKKIQFVEDRPEEAAKYRARAPERIREAYTWESITDQYEEFFLQLANGQDPMEVHSTVLPKLCEQEPLVNAASAGLNK
jgi:glycosyltransferase involved in cell wall biosynthesis